MRKFLIESEDKSEVRDDIVAQKIFEKVYSVYTRANGHFRNKNFKELKASSLNLTALENIAINLRQHLKKQTKKSFFEIEPSLGKVSFEHINENDRPQLEAFVKRLDELILSAYRILIDGTKAKLNQGRNLYN